MILKLWERNGRGSDGTNGEKEGGREGSKYLRVCVCVVVKGSFAVPR